MPTPGGPFEPESLKELSRFVQYHMNGIDKQFTELFTRIDKIDVVSRDQYREDMARLKEQRIEDNQELRDEIKEVKREQETFQTRLTNQTRWLIGSLLLPLVGVVLTVYGLMKGVGG